MAGLGKMSYWQFSLYNIIGACLWVGLLVPAGRMFGNLPIVKEYFSLVILAIIAISLLPIVVEVWKEIRRRRLSDRAPCRRASKPC